MSSEPSSASSGVRAGGVAAVATLVLVLSFSRLWGLDARLPHHDEMVHHFFSEALAAKGTYRADPTYHGPLLYHLEAAVFGVAGSGLWQARVIPALAGIAAALALVLLARRESGTRAACVVAVLVTLSPSWLYYSRFNAHDTLILLATALVAWGRWHWTRGATGAATWVIVLALAFAASTKLNVLFIAGAILAWPVVRRVAAGHGRLVAPLAAPPLATLAGAVVVAVLVVAPLFATTYSAHLVTGTPGSAGVATVRAVLVDPVIHWLGQHRQQRLGGPFHYYALLLAICEPLLVMGVLIALVHGWRRSGRSWRLAVRLIIMGGVLAAVLWPARAVLKQVLHVHPLHLVGLPLATYAAWTLLRQRVRDQDEAGAWWAWMALSQTGLYSYAGEKVPWLGVHVALPWIMLAGPALAQGWTRWYGDSGRRVHLLTRALALALLLVTLHGAIAVTTWNRSNVGEPIVQLEYDPATHRLLARIRDACDRIETGAMPCLVTSTDAGWPASWYLRASRPGSVVTDLDAASGTTPFVFAPARRIAKPGQPTFEATHDAENARFGAWGMWVAWANRPRPFDLARFWVWRRSLGPRRGSPYELWVRRDLAVVWNATAGERP